MSTYTASNDLVIIRRDKVESKAAGATKLASGLFLPAGAEDPDADKKDLRPDTLATGTIYSVGPNALEKLYWYDPQYVPGYTQAGYIGDKVLFATAQASSIGDGLVVINAAHIIAHVED